MKKKGYLPRVAVLTENDREWISFIIESDDPKVTRYKVFHFWPSGDSESFFINSKQGVHDFLEAWRWVAERMGYSKCVVYRTETIAEVMSRVCPEAFGSEN